MSLNHFPFLYQARLSRKLVELERNIPFDALFADPSQYSSLSDIRMEKFNEQRLLSFYDDMGLRDLKKRLQDRLIFIARNEIRANKAASYYEKKEQKYKQDSAPSFSSKKRFQSPPKPGEYDDVPF